MADNLRSVSCRSPRYTENGCLPPTVLPLAHNFSYTRLDNVGSTLNYLSAGSEFDLFPVKQTKDGAFVDFVVPSSFVSEPT